MDDRRELRPPNPNPNPTVPNRYIPVRNPASVVRPAPVVRPPSVTRPPSVVRPPSAVRPAPLVGPGPASRIPRPIPQRGPVGGVAPRGSRIPVRQQAPQAQRQQQPPPPPQPLPPPPEPQPPPAPRPVSNYPDTRVDVETIVPVRQARPPTSPGSRRASQPLVLPPALKGPAAAGGHPLAQPNYDLDWLPEDERLLNNELALAYTNEILEALKGQQLRAARQEVAEGTRENEVLYRMLESGVPFDVIDKFLERGYEEDEAEQRETEHFEKLEQMIADEADDIDLALTLSRFDLEKNPRRRTVPTLDFAKSGRVRHQRQKFQKSLHDVRKGIEAMTVLAEEDEPEEVQPELAAAMMYTEECGPGMTNPPNDMFAFLFSNQPDEPSEDLAETGPLVVQEGRPLVPATPEEIAEQRDSRLLGREAGAFTPPGRMSPGLPGARSPARHIRGAAGAPLPPPRPQAVWANVRECRRSEITKRFNLVQMCGSHPPFWFRGYFEAFPHTLGRISISRSPSMTLQTAWYLTRPETYKMNRRLMVKAV